MRELARLPRISVLVAAIVAGGVTGTTARGQEAPPAPTEPAASEAPATLAATEENARAIEAYNEAIVAANEGRLADAIVLLERYVDSTAPKEMRDRARAQLEQIRAVEKRDRHVLQFNAAIEQLKRKDPGEAAEILESILADDPNEKMRADVEKQLKRIGGKISKKAKRDKRR